MRADPVRQFLAFCRFRKSVARRTEHRDEDLCKVNLAGQGINDRNPVAAVVDKQFLANLVGLPHGEFETAAVLPVMHAELRILGKPQTCHLTPTPSSLQPLKQEGASMKMGTEFWMGHVAAAKLEAISASEYSRRHGISVAALYYWQRKLRTADTHQEVSKRAKTVHPSKFVALHVLDKVIVPSLDNLVDFIVTCITHPQAANQTFLVSDGQDLSTTELVRGMARAAGVPARLLPVPVWALQAGASLLGKGDAVQRLCGNLQVDISKARSLLGWVPPVSVEEGLRRAMTS